MACNSQPVAGDADEHAHPQRPQSDVHIQVSDERGLSQHQGIYPGGFYDDFLGPAFSNEGGHFDWNATFGDASFRDTSLGMTTPGSDYSQESAAPSMFGSVLDMDDRNLLPFPTRQRHTPTVAESTTSSRKRSLTETFATNQAEEYVAGGPRKRTRPDAEVAQTTRAQFACPFQKLDALKHHECLKYALHRIKDVKQHIYRRHKQPDYYCARCFVVFATADSRDEHTRSRDCENKKRPPFEGITDVEKAKLNKSPSRGLDAQEQWFKMWEIIFPGEMKPSSVFVGTYMEEMVPVLRSLWARKDSSILAMVQRDHPSPLDPSLLSVVMKSLFDCLEVEVATSLGKQTLGTSSQDQPSLTGSQAPISTNPSRGIIEPPELLYPDAQYFLHDTNAQPQAGMLTYISRPNTST